MDFYLWLGQRVNTVHNKSIVTKIKGIWLRFKLTVCIIRFCFSFVWAKKPVKMAGYNYVDRKLDVTSHNKDYTSVGPCEISIARHSMLV